MAQEDKVEDLMDNLVEYRGGCRFENSREGHLMAKGARGELKGPWKNFLLFRPLAGTCHFPVSYREVKIAA